MHRHVRRVGDQISLGVEDRAGEIEAFLDVHRVAGIGKRHAHLLGNRHEQIVEDLKQNRVGCRANGVGAFGLFRTFQHEVILCGDHCAPLGLNDRRRDGFLDDGGPDDDVAGTQVFAIEHLRWSQRVVTEYFDFGARTQTFNA